MIDLQKVSPARNAKPEIALSQHQTSGDVILLLLNCNGGMFPLMKEMNIEVAKTDSSQATQLLTDPAWCSLPSGVVVRVQGPGQG
jgi:hypothetical protein